MAKISWGRGFFRVWMLLTILWLIGAGAIAYGPIFNPYIPGQSFNMSKLGEGTLYDTYGPAQEGLKAAVASGSLMATTVRPGYDVYTPIGLAPEQQTEFLAQGRSAIEFYINREASTRRSAAIPTVLAWTLLPPLIVLLLGWAIGWAISGFRRTA